MSNRELVRLAVEKVLEKPLTNRELELLECVVTHGMKNEEIADKMVLSVKTVEAHKSHIRSKLREDVREATSIHAPRMFALIAAYWYTVGYDEGLVAKEKRELALIPVRQ